jgi:hypothetical protein
MVIREPYASTAYSTGTVEKEEVDPYYSSPPMSPLPLSWKTTIGLILLKLCVGRCTVEHSLSDYSILTL